MKELTIERTAVNIESLDAALRAALSEKVFGVSVALGFVTVHLADKLAEDDLDLARRLVLQHDPAVLTERQQQTQRRIAILEEARKSNTTDLDATKFTDPQLAELARKVAWLEQEILALRPTR